MKWTGLERRSDSQCRDGTIMQNVGYNNYMGLKVLEMQLPGKRKRERPKRRYFDVIIGGHA